ncbi:LGFP repeat-containing protein [Kineococcus xinjiangensis]|uniref:LGFP repeat-containing protein n=1 Tax=Kineococcus xinjiangensis TaxID=512762 RepID=A0A2S6ICE2_9ACTN|nr:hypothetical protein [Kineococcus xinjiangensis]PPK91894.1 LGFP repeat-containing protein [Kineococcus xinjiangensis]
MTSWKLRAAGALAAAVAAVTMAAPAQADPRVGGEIGFIYEHQHGGASGWLGQPLTPEIRTPNGKGAYVVFQNGSIYWSPGTGAREVHGELRNGWGRLGWEGGYLGFPTSDEQPTASRRGRFQTFQGGALYWAPWTGAHAVRGDIRDTYASWYQSEDILGFPITSEVRTPNNRGAYNHFQWGSIYWSPDYGAFPIYGAIRDLYASQGWENGPLGFPVSAEFDYALSTVGEVKGQEFEGGFIWWWPEGHEIYLTEG